MRVRPHASNLNIVPAWAKNAVFYQIFPDRFCRSLKYKAVGKFVQWDTFPTSENMFAGNLAGIIDKLKYIASLGVTAIYLCPIFKSNSNHRYHTVDYFEIDPVLGTLEDFDALVQKAHELNLRIILDGVFNHCSRGFFQFNSLLELGKNSPYVDWFYVHSWPIEAYSSKANYDCWWNFPALPKFNTNCKDVRDYLFSVVEFWTKRGIDGWRLDVPNEIDDDSFWQEFRQRVKKINKNAYIVGEIWDNPSRWLQGDQFDGVMNYMFRRTLLAYLFDEKPIDSKEFCKRLQECFPENRFGVPMNLLSSHDTIRLASLPCSNENRVKLALTILFFLPGAPCVYYGEEIGMEGGKDPDNRRTFPWNSLKKAKNKQIFTYLKKLIALRKESLSLRDGHLRIKSTQDGFVISRVVPSETMELRVLDGKIDTCEGFVVNKN